LRLFDLLGRDFTVVQPFFVLVEILLGVLDDIAGTFDGVAKSDCAKVNDGRVEAFIGKAFEFWGPFGSFTTSAMVRPLNLPSLLKISTDSHAMISLTTRPCGTTS
jgi:hypothetical protein